MKRHQSARRRDLLLVIGIAFFGFSSSTVMAADPVVSSGTMTLDDKFQQRQLVRGRSSVSNQDNVIDEDESTEDFDNRELAREKRRNGNDDSNSSEGGSEGSVGSKNSKSSKGGSKGSKGDGGRSSGPSCGAGCGDKDFAYIHLQGSYFFRSFNDDSVDVVPIEGTGRLNNTKDGSTIRILDQDLKGYAKYFDHGDDHPVKNDIHGSISGSCMLLATYEGETKRVDSELCLAHCTLCVAYEGQCCQASKSYEGEWGEPWGKESCETYGGYATITADLLFALEFRNGTGSSLISIPEGGLVSLEGLGPITGTALELNAAANGGLGFIEYDALNRPNGDTYKIGMKVPFNDDTSCKLQNELVELDIPPPSPPTISLPAPAPFATAVGTTASTTTVTSTTVATTTAATTSDAQITDPPPVPCTNTKFIKIVRFENQSRVRLVGKVDISRKWRSRRFITRPASPSTKVNSKKKELESEREAIRVEFRGRKGMGETRENARYEKVIQSSDWHLDEFERYTVLIYMMDLDDNRQTTKTCFIGDFSSDTVAPTCNEIEVPNVPYIVFQMRVRSESLLAAP